MSEFQKLLTDVKSALQRPAGTRHHTGDAAVIVPMTEVTRRAELGSKFVRELQAVGGQVIEAGSEIEAVEKIVDLALRIGVTSVVCAEPITEELGAVDGELQKHGITVINTEPVGKDEFVQLRARIARADMGIVEADHAIAATGTLAQIASANRPRLVSLLPPTSVVVLHIDKIVPDLAALTRTIGPDRIRDDPMVLITGPSRTADIEKRIVMGVHGPKDLYVLLIWPKDE